jgi:hypothetical protein
VKRQRLEGAAVAAAAGAAEGSVDEDEESEEDEGGCHSTHQPWACMSREAGRLAVHKLLVLGMVLRARL